MNRSVVVLYAWLVCLLSMQAQTRQQMGGIYYAYPEGPSALTGTFGTDSCCTLASSKISFDASSIVSSNDTLNPLPAGFAPFISVITGVTVRAGWRTTNVMYGYAAILRMKEILRRLACR